MLLMMFLLNPQAAADDGQTLLVVGSPPCVSTSLSDCEITTDGSFFLGASFTSSATHAILIRAPHVSLDLNGHTIAHSGSGAAIRIGSPTPTTRTVVRNGHIHATTGILADVRSARIEGVQITGAQRGIIVDHLDEGTIDIVENVVITDGSTGAVGVEVIGDCTFFDGCDTSVRMEGNVLTGGELAAAHLRGTTARIDSNVLKTNEVASSGPVLAMMGGVGSLIEDNLLHGRLGGGACIENELANDPLNIHDTMITDNAMMSCNHGVALTSAERITLLRNYTLNPNLTAYSFSNSSDISATFNFVTDANLYQTMSSTTSIFRLGSWGGGGEGTPGGSSVTVSGNLGAP
ncbi:MAG: hypothetical protein AAFV53_39385 [Myxococcota bacterium]